MSNWSTHQFTRKGEQLRAKVEAGKCKLTLTKIKIGNGNVTLGEVKDMNDLKSPQLVIGISSCDVSAEDDRICEVVGIASSNNVESAFSVTEMGLFASDPDVGEILYLVGIDTAPDDMPNKNASSPATLTYQFEIVTSNMANVVAMISPAGLVTVKMMNAHRTAAALDHPDKSVKRKHLADEVYTLPKPEAANNARFLRNDGTWQQVTADNIGAYTKGETNNLLAQKAPLASPALTGIPTVPTAGKGTNNEQIASTAFVAQAIAALVNSAPGTLDTLQELAAALGNDANFATTITNALAGKLGKTETAARAAALEGWFLERNRTYQVGDIAYARELPSCARLECVRAGTTGGSPPNLTAINRCGVMVTDGSVVWIVDDLRDGTPVGVVRGSLYVPAGYVKANGALVQRADYPRLVALADRYNLWTNDVPRYPGLFGRADHSTTMILPNWIDRMVQLSECNNGTEFGNGIDAGLPNIKSLQQHTEMKHPLVGNANSNTNYGTGFMQFRIHNASDRFSGGRGDGGHVSYGDIDFDASRVNPIYGASNTVQPAAIKMLPIIKY